MKTRLTDRARGAAAAEREDRRRVVDDVLMPTICWKIASAEPDDQHRPHARAEEVAQASFARHHLPDLVHLLSTFSLRRWSRASTAPRLVVASSLHQPAWAVRHEDHSDRQRRARNRPQSEHPAPVVARSLEERSRRCRRSGFPCTIISWLNDTSPPRIRRGATSAMYMGDTKEAVPTESPSRKRAAINSVAPERTRSRAPRTT